MVRKTKEDALETRGLLLDTAARLFEEKGVSRTSLADIAEAAGVTRGAIYWHFKNKCELFNAMFDRVHLPMEELIEAKMAADAQDPLGTLRDTIVECMQSIVTDEWKRRVFSILLHKCEMTDEMGPIFERHQEHHARGRKRLEASLRNAINAAQLPASLDVRRAAALLHAQLVGMINDSLFSRDSLNLAEDADLYVDACMDMLKSSTALRLAH